MRSIKFPNPLTRTGCLTELGCGATGKALFTAPTASAGLDALGIVIPLTVAQGGTGGTTQATARSALGSGTVGDSLFTAADAAAARIPLGIRRFVKASNDDRTNTSTVSADSELAGISVVSGTVYRVRLRLNCYYFSGSTGGVKFTLTGSPVAFNSLNGYGWANYFSTSTIQGIAASGSSIFILNVSGSPTDSQSQIIAEVTFKALATGNIALSWAQNSAVVGATLRLLAGSMISIEAL